MTQFTCVSLGVYQVFYSIIRERLTFSNYADFREKNISFYAIKFKHNSSWKTTPLTYNHGLPWWLSGENLPANAGDIGSIPHPLKQLSPCATTIEPVL